MNKRKAIGIAIIVVGACIFMYPIVKQAYARHVQEQLMHEIKQVITENMTEEDQGQPSTVTSQDNPTKTPTSTLEENYTDLALMEGTQEEEETPETTKERLKNQKVIGIIEIDKIDLIYAIVEGTSDSNLGVAIGHMSETAALGQVGNSALAGHRGGTSGPYFKYINKLEEGDPIKVTDVEGIEYIYNVTESFIVDPTDVWVAENTTTDKLLTLISCTENGSRRLIVRAKAE